MRNAGKILIILMVASMALTVVATAAWASSGASEAPRRVNTENVIDFEEAVGVGEGGHESKIEEPFPGSLNGAITEGEAEEQGGESEEGGEEHHPWWMFPGWQSVFTVLAVAYYAMAVLGLPKIMAKEEHH